MEIMYFGHPVNFYNVPKEQELISVIKLRFPDFVIENPNQPRHQDGYQDYKTRAGRGMDYFFQIVLPQCHAGTFLTFEDGKFGAGVFGEAQLLHEQRKLIYEIDLSGKIQEMVLDISRKLSIEETRERVYGKK